MDIHKPKPWHGVREFLKEYAFIVVGVLTALGAEQGVEWLHWQEKIGAGETQITRELTASSVFADEKIAVAPCLDRRLADLEDRLLAPGTAWTPLPPMVHPGLGPTVYEMPSRNWPGEVWRSLLADGTVGHLDSLRQVSLEGAYIQIAELNAVQHEEDGQIGELNTLARPLDLDRGQRVALVRLIEQERWRVRTTASVAGQLRRRVLKLTKQHPLDAKAMSDVRTEILANSGTLKACRGLGLLPPAAH
jgi:hypothetical protein